MIGMYCCEASPDTLRTRILAFMGDWESSLVTLLMSAKDEAQVTLLYTPDRIAIVAYSIMLLRDSLQR
jgi:hypothetical protein